MARCNKLSRSYKRSHPIITGYRGDLLYHDASARLHVEWNLLLSDLRGADIQLPSACNRARKEESALVSQSSRCGTYPAGMEDKNCCRRRLMTPWVNSTRLTSHDSAFGSLKCVHEGRRNTGTRGSLFTILQCSPNAC
jgi:hypothetical protein